MSDALEICKKHVEAEDRQDVEATLATFTEDCYYKMPSFGIDLKGKEEIRAHYTQAFQAFENFHNENERWFEAENNVFLIVDMVATHDRPWHGIQPSGRPINLSFLAHFPLADDGLLKAEIVYANAPEMLRQMGVLPEDKDLFAMASEYQELKARLAEIDAAT